MKFEDIKKRILAFYYFELPPFSYRPELLGEIETFMLGSSGRISLDSEREEYNKEYVGS